VATADILLATGLVDATPIACGAIAIGAACTIRTCVTRIANQRTIDTTCVCKTTLNVTSFARIHNTVTADGAQTGYSTGIGFCIGIFFPIVALFTHFQNTIPATVEPILKRHRIALFFASALATHQGSRTIR